MKNLVQEDLWKMGRNSYLRVAKFIVRIFSWDPVWWRLIWFPNKCHLLIELSVWARTPAEYISLSIGEKNQWLLKNHAPAACGMLNTLNCLLIFISEPLDIYKSSCWLLVQIKTSNSTNIKISYFTAISEILCMFICVVWDFRSLDTSPLKKILLLHKWMKKIWFSLFLENNEL